MPALITHHLFGKGVLSRIGGGAFPTRDERDAFLLGNQGPDPLFYAAFTPQLVELKRFGNTLHTVDVDASISAMRDYVRTLDTNDRKVADAWLCGYLCHFCLDSTAHPFIYSWEHALISAGVKGLDQRAAGPVHSQIEADLDAMMLYRLTGNTIREFVVPRQALYASDRVLKLLDVLLAHVAATVYNRQLPADAFTRSVKDMRTSVRVLYSPSGFKRDVIGRIERLFSPHSRAQALSHRADVFDESPFNNSGHQTWVHPFTGQTNDASFTDLFNRAFDIAVQDLKLHEEGAPTSQLTLGLDFEGRPTI